MRKAPKRSRAYYAEYKLDSQASVLWLGARLAFAACLSNGRALSVRTSIAGGLRTLNDCDCHCNGCNWQRQRV